MARDPVTPQPITTLTVGTVSGQDFLVNSQGDPEKLARQILTAPEGGRPLQLYTTDAREVWVRPEHVETVTYSALEV